MPPLNLIATYFPPLSDIASAEVQNMRTRLATFWLAAWPEQDCRPGSLFGDRVITPLAYFMCMLEIAMDRFRSDLTLANVAGGVIYDCDFVEGFLKNFAVQRTEGLLATGVMRLVFNSDARREIDRGCMFQFKSSTDNVFGFRLFSPGPVVILPVGVAAETSGNIFYMRQLSENTYSVDIPVVGQMLTQVVAGDSAGLSAAVTGLVSAAAALTFDTGSGPTSLPALAEKTRTAFWGASMNTRYSARQYVMREFNDLVAASVTLPGDREMLRGAVNALGFATNAADIYVRSALPMVAESQVVRLAYIDEPLLGLADCYFGQLVLAGVATRLSKVSSDAHPTVILDDGVESLVVYSQTTSSAAAPGLAAGFSKYEKLWIKIAMPRDDDGNPLVVATIDSNGDSYAMFKLEYTRDPIVPIVADFLSSEDNTPTNVRVLVKAFLPLSLDSLTITYTRRAGTLFNAEQARTEIHQYLMRLGHPDNFTNARISDAMFYAGASNMRSITCRGSLKWSLGSRLLAADVDPTTDGVDDYETPNRLDLRSADQFAVSYRDALAAAGERNIAFILNKADIIFVEEL